MINLSELEQLIAGAMKARDTARLDALRALKTRIQNEKISKGAELDEADITKLLQSEVKRRKESYEAFSSAGRAELAEKESQEITILSEFLPPAIGPEVILAKAQELVAANNWTQKDFGSAMAELKTALGAGADGAVMASVLKGLLSK